MNSCENGNIREAMERPPWEARTLCGCLFASGFAALAFEVVWTRLLLYSYGNTVPAMTTVVTAVMAGLGLGSLAGGRIADRSRNPARLYGFLELCLAATGLATPYVLSAVRSLYLHHSPSISDSGGATGPFLRYGLTLGALVVPSLLMGATLPAAGLALRRAGHAAGRAAGRAYGWNTLGAAFGTFAAGYFLLPAVGIGWTNRIAAFVSLSAGLSALLLASRPGFRGAPAEDTSPESSPPVSLAGRDGVLLVSLAVSGLVGMLLQIVWVRSLTLVVGSLTYSLSGIFSAFLLGIGAGSLLHARMFRRDQPPRFGPLMAGVAVSALLLVPFFEFLPGIFLTLFNAWGGSPARVKLIRFLVVLPVVAVPTTLLGYIVPAWIGYLAREGRRFGGRFGAVYAWNTAGAVAGSVLTGFLLVPRLGAQKTLVAGAILAALCGTVLSVLFGNGRNRIAAGIALALSVGAAFLPPWDIRLLNSGVYYAAREVRDIAALTTSRFTENLYFREGIGATVAVARFRSDRTGLIINGKVDASNGGGDMETQVKLAAIPMLLHPGPRRAAVIGLGSGVTSGTAALFEEARSIETIEEEPAVAEAARFFERENRGVLRDPRHRLRIGDARSHFMAPGRAYDIVISEPSNPWLAGESDLFTAEFFRSVRNRLAPGGIFCQWIHGYSISPEAFRVVTRTFRSVFPGATLWSGGPLDFLLIGSPEGPVRVDPKAIQKRFDHDPGLRSVAAYFDNTPGENFADDLVLGPDRLATFSGEGPLHEDDHPILEFLAADSLYLPPSQDTLLREILAAERGGGFAVHVAQDAARYWRVGKHHLSRSRPLQAAEEFFQAYTLGWRPRPGWEEPGRLAASSGLPGGVPLDLYPAIGAYRPEEHEETRSWAVWVGSMDLFLDTSGIRRDGKHGEEKVLRISGLAGTSYASFFLPVPVSPSSEYEVAFGMIPPADPEVSAGCAVMEFDTLFPGNGQPSKDATNLHHLETVVGIRVPGGADASRKRHAFRFRTSPVTKMVHIHYFREGKPEGGDALFGGIDVRPVR